MKVEDKKEQIKDFYQDNKRMPTYSEMMDMFDYKSKNSVYKLVKKLVAAGVIDQDEQGRLLPNQLNSGIKVLGLIQAGFPTTTSADEMETMSLDQFLIKKRDASYLLKVEGLSMKDAGILPGDLVLVEKTDQARDGDIVIAEVDGEWTMKYLKLKRGQIYLQAANDQFKPIYPDSDMKVAAIVKAVIRKYR